MLQTNTTTWQRPSAGSHVSDFVTWKLRHGLPTLEDWRCEPADKTPARAQAARRAQQQHRPTATALRRAAVHCAWCCTLYTCGYTQMRQESHRVETQGTQQACRWINPQNMPPCWCMNAQSKAHGTQIKCWEPPVKHPSWPGQWPQLWELCSQPAPLRELVRQIPCSTEDNPVHATLQAYTIWHSTTSWPLQTKNCTTYLHRTRLSVTRSLQLRACQCMHAPQHTHTAS